jgi:hypothetical protein
MTPALVLEPSAPLGAARLALETHLCVRVPRTFDATTCAEMVRGVYASREEWTHDFDGEQFCLGRAWYTHLETDRVAEYFADAAATDARVEKYCPGLQRRMRELIGRAIGASVVARRGFCGPGVHVFPAGGWVAENGGEIHFDTEGLAPAHARARNPAITCVLMLQPPESGGALRLWDTSYAGSDAVTDAMVERPSYDADYQLGELVILDSYRLHQIQPFGGALDRVSATCHAAYVAGQWEAWF